MMGYRKIAVYGIFVLTLAYGIYFHFLGNDSVRIITADPATIAASVQSPSTVSPAITLEKPPSRPGFISDIWERDPFRFSRSLQAAPVGKTSDPNPKPGKPRLSAISRSGDRNMAVVDGRIMQVGESVGKWQLIEVTEDSALLEGPEGRVWIRIGG